MKHLIRKSLLAVAVLGMVTMLGGESAQATTATSNLAVSAFVNGNCTISTAAVSFGNYDTALQAAAHLDNSGGGVTLVCTANQPWTIRLGQGLNADAGSTAAAPLRRMVGPAPTDFLSYNLYTTNGFAAVWGDTTLTGVSGTGTGAAQATSVHGRVFMGQAPSAGAYNDTVVASVDF